MLIEVSETHPPRPGGKVGYLHAADGQRYECWPDKLEGVQVGRRYEIETRSREYEGRTILSITRITPAAATTNNRLSDSTRSPPASAAAGEAEYVGRVLSALIAKGEVNKAQIATATHWLRSLWREG